MGVSRAALGHSTDWIESELNFAVLEKVHEFIAFLTEIDSGFHPSIFFVTTIHWYLPSLVPVSNPWLLYGSKDVEYFFMTAGVGEEIAEAKRDVMAAVKAFSMAAISGWVGGLAACSSSRQAACSAAEPFGCFCFGCF